MNYLLKVVHSFLKEMRFTFMRFLSRKRYFFGPLTGFYTSIMAKEHAGQDFTSLNLGLFHDQDVVYLMTAYTCLKSMCTLLLLGGDSVTSL